MLCAGIWFVTQVLLLAIGYPDLVLFNFLSQSNEC